MHKKPRKLFQLTSYVCYDFENIYFKRVTVIFWTLSLFYLFSLYFERSLSKNEQKRISSKL